MPLHARPLALIKSIILHMEAAFPKAIVQIIRLKNSFTLVTYVVNQVSGVPYTHQIHITVRTKTPGKLCLQWFKETNPVRHSYPLGDRLDNDGGVISFRDPNGQSGAFRNTQHIMAVPWSNTPAFQGWVARTRYHIDPDADCPAWGGLNVRRDSIVADFCWSHGETAPNVGLDQGTGKLILRPGDPDSPIIVYDG